MHAPPSSQSRIAKSTENPQSSTWSSKTTLITVLEATTKQGVPNDIAMRPASKAPSLCMALTGFLQLPPL